MARSIEPRLVSMVTVRVSPAGQGLGLARRAVRRVVAVDRRRRAPRTGPRTVPRTGSTRRPGPTDAGGEQAGEDERCRRARRDDGTGGGSCGSLQGSGKVDGAGEDGLPEDDAGGAGIAQPAEAVEVADPAGHQDLGMVRPNERYAPGPRSGSVPPWVTTSRATPAPSSSPTSASRVGGAGRRHGNAASRSGRGSSPTASQSPAMAQAGRQVVRPVGDGRGHDDPRRAGGEGELDGLRPTRRRRPAAAARPCATRWRRRPRGWPGRPAAPPRSRPGG